jgi:type II secretion system protein C
MGFSFSERYVTILNFLLIAVIVYFLAQSVSDVMKLHLASEVVPAGTEFVASHASRANPARPRHFYDVIIQRDIFNLAPAPEATAEPAEDLQLKLLGTSHLTSGKPFVIVEDSSGNQSLYRLGDKIPNVGRVVEISQSRTVILHNGHRVAIEIPQADDAQPLQPFPRATHEQPFINSPMRRRHHGALRAPDAGVHKLGSNRYVLDRSTVNNNLQNMAQLFTEIRAIPNLQNGVAHGFRLSEIQTGSIFQQIGLTDGDILTAAEGEPINDPVKAMSLLGSLRNRSTITLNVIRNGAPVQLYYNIR